MGVQGLLTYIETQCPEALANVNLKRLGEEYHRKHNIRPVLLLDCNPFIRNIYGNLEFAFGGQWIQHFENVKRFVDAFHNAGFQLVVLFDSVIEKKKLKVWVDRRKKERKLVSTIFQDVKRNERHPNHTMFHVPPGLSSFTRLALKSLGVSVRNSTMEVDRECYLYAKKHQCFGVVSRDTDLLIYDIPQVFFLTYSSGRIQKVQQFRKDVLCQHLGLPPHHLALFACLVGCDSTKNFMLSKFHNMVTRGRRDPLIPCVAGFIRSLQLRDLSRETLDWVASQVVKSLGNGVLFECVQDYICDAQESGGASSRPLGISSGDGNVTSARIDPGVMNRLRACHEDLSITDFVMLTIGTNQLTGSMTFEDDDDASMPSAALVYRLIRQCLYGILLHTSQPERESATSEPSSIASQHPAYGTVEEVCCYAGYSLDTPDIVQGLPIEMSPQPRVEDLWVDSVDSHRLRLQVFFSCMSSTRLLEEGILKAVPDHHILLCCILHYLLLKAPETTLRSCDVDAFISQAICLQWHNPFSLRKLKVHRASARGIHLASIFLRGVAMGCAVNSTCCLPFKMDSLLPWCMFDGKLFHLKYLAAESGQTPAQLCDNRANAIEAFHEMRRRIVMGTRLDQ